MYHTWIYIMLLSININKIVYKNLKLICFLQKIMFLLCYTLKYCNKCLEHTVATKSAPPSHPHILGILGQKIFLWLIT